MKYGKLRYVERPVSRLIFGTAIPDLFAAMRSVHGDEPDFVQKLDKAFRLLDRVYELGIQTFEITLTETECKWLDLQINER